MSFEDNLLFLENIVAKLRDEALSLSDAISLFAQSQDALAQARIILDEGEGKIFQVALPAASPSPSKAKAQGSKAGKTSKK